ncbi:Diaminopimelate epimerase-like protein [Marasmius fiardii PR-910]|nr:Diaminopimelate epimerase-like protein [Marasmius fiardii PR-910]
MDVFNKLAGSEKIIKCVDMHTSGEPTRIVVSGYPKLVGNTLLEKRRYASEKLDFVREQLMLEPRGHDGMYGAILVQETELTKRGEADIGVLFCHNEGYSTMCGHATIALGRFLIDTHDENVIPKRNSLRFSAEKRQINLRLHAPCGVVRVTVPTTPDGEQADGTRPVRFISVPSFASRRNIAASIHPDNIWTSPRTLKHTPEGRISIPIDVAFGGAFYIIVSVQNLGFDGLDQSHLPAFLRAARALADQVRSDDRMVFNKELFHAKEEDVEFLYGVIIVEQLDARTETGLCFFAGDQIDRSPTGSGVCARVALAVEEGRLEMNEWFTYHSIWSRKSESEGASDGFRGRAIERFDDGSVLVEVEGRGFYTGCSSFVAPEPADVLGRGFSLLTKS